MKSPAFQFYPDDFMGGKPGLMNPDETHVYIWLLCLDWNQKGFTFCAKSLAKWCRIPRGKFVKSWATVRECFELGEDGRYYNKRLAAERLKQEAWREKSRRGGLHSGETRAKGGSTTVQPPHEPNTNIPFPLPSPVTTTTTPQPPVAADAARPRKKANSEPSPEEAAVLAHYVETHPKRRPGEGDLKAVRRALGFGYSPAELKRAITGNAGDEWHRERRKHGLGYVLRNNEKIDDFIAKADALDEPWHDLETGEPTAAGLAAGMWDCLPARFYNPARGAPPS